MGLHFSTIAYQTYVLPVLSFLAQFKKPNEKALEAEDKAIRMLVPGPGQWCLKEDFYRLQQCWGQHRSFPSLTDLSLAARTRLYKFENFMRGGLGVKSKFRALQNVIRDHDSIGRWPEWFSWFNGGIIADVFSCEEELRTLELSIPSLIEAAAPPVEEGDERRTHKLRRRNFQRTVRRAIFSTHKYNEVERMRHKLGRWCLGDFPGVTSSRCIKALRSLRGLVPPRVSAAVLRTMWNGWCTGRRFQKYDTCCFRCGSFFQEDSIEHYGRCPIVVGFARTKLRIRPNVWNLSYITTLGLAESACTNEDLTVRALWIYAAYRAHNLLRYKPLSAAEDPADILLQFSKEGSLGHEGAMRTLDTIWSNSSLPQRADYSNYFNDSDEDIWD